jgi:hypothetical protein
MANERLPAGGYLGTRGKEVFEKIRPLSDIPISRAAYYAWQKQWDAGEIGTDDTE